MPTDVPHDFPNSHHFKCDDLGKHVAIVGNRTCDFGEANARRIVACVNACAGIDTELLEIIADNDKTLAGVIAELEKQRDTLLAAVKLCVPELRAWMNCHGEDLQTIAAIKTSEAAIASVKEQA